LSPNLHLSDYGRVARDPTRIDAKRPFQLILFFESAVFGELFIGVVAAQLNAFILADVAVFGDGELLQYSIMVG